MASIGVPDQNVLLVKPNANRAKGSAFIHLLRYGNTAVKRTGTFGTLTQQEPTVAKAQQRLSSWQNAAIRRGYAIGQPPVPTSVPLPAPRTLPTSRRLRRTSLLRRQHSRSRKDSKRASRRSTGPGKTKRRSHKGQPRSIAIAEIKPIAVANPSGTRRRRVTRQTTLSDVNLLGSQRAQPRTVWDVPLSYAQRPSRRASK